jgi:hypothetical protein
MAWSELVLIIVPVLGETSEGAKGEAGRPGNFSPAVLLLIVTLAA